ncbi:PhzF family phenazine biosynthesis protein [Halobaculum sp. P14]|uniref:PhzF family phenazine biosynthesis protein n=1 Tax=Halobaculum sp. P14 TaxID=3421638 RepID=UPI003EBD1968
MDSDTDSVGGESRAALLVDAFTTEPLAGNAAGVVPDADGLTDDQMQAVARELSVSETAFVLPSADADRRVRYFTPTTEVDLCGHATIATHAHLAETGAVDPGAHTLETNVGVLDVEVTDDGRVWMTQNSPEVYEVDVDYDRVGDALGCDPNAFRDVGAELPVAYATSGLPFLVVPVNFLERVGNMDPDFAAVEALAADHDAAGVYAFTFDALDAESTLHGRCFVPGAGVPEDPVTGTASGACGAYLDHFGAFDGTADVMTFEQGHFVDRPGHVYVRAAGGRKPTVGGDAVTAFDGTIRVPEPKDDDIIEA